MKPRTLRHPGRWIWLLLLVPAAIGLVRLRLDVEVFDLLPADLKVVQGLKLYQKHFTNARQLLLTVKASDGDQAENAARAISETLRQHSNLVASVTWEPPWLEHPEQAAELLAYLWFNQPPGVFAELTNKFTPVQLAASLNDTRVQLTTSLSPEEIARLSYDPFGLTRLPESTASAAPSFAQGQQLFKSPDGLFRLIFVQAAREL
ncbi:MAG TPA: hypothetical protein VLT36_23985, partial [Candidatus Dormibacteraeota bacterium]|nr:hypothetical protein [Candidatus Dormibacteraeota bacterium]